MFDFLKSIFSGDGSDKPKKNRSNVSVEELRLYARYPLIHKKVGKIKILDNGQTGEILNLSYGGVLVKFDDPWTGEINPNEATSFSAELDILSQSSLTNIQFIHNIDEANYLAGFAFQHRNVETLVFLREILERFRVGSSLRTPPSEMLKEEYRSGNWRCFRGEGPTDFFVSTSSTNREAFLNFRNGSSKLELRLKDNKFTTRRTIDLGESNDQIETADTNQSIDPVILRQGVEILIGSASNEQTEKYAKEILIEALKQY